MKYALVLLILLIFSFLIITCNDSQEKPAELQELEFAIDTSLISVSIADSVYLIRFSPPVNWQLMPLDILKGLAKEHGEIRIVPLYIFGYAEQFSALNVSKIEFSDTTIQDKTKFELYEKIIKEAFSDQLIKQGNFKKDGIIIHQFLIKSDKMINFKLIFKNSKGEYIQFDYSSQNEHYPKVLKAIESSIGSIKLIN